MHKRKFQSKRQLRKELVCSYEKPFSPKRIADIHWQLLGKLIQDCPLMEDSVRTAVQAACTEKSVDAYFQLQKFADPQLYESAGVYYHTASVLSFLKKYPFGKVAGLDPEMQAIKRFRQAEMLCRQTNKRISFYRKHSDRLQTKLGTDVYSAFRGARRLIAGWLGPLDLNKIYDYTRHGPGGSIGVTGDSTTAVYKYAANQYTVTTRAFPYAEAAILADPLWRRYVATPEGFNTCGDYVPTADDCREAVRQRLEVINYNKVTFVPKTAQTHRAIAVEPLMNVYLQLGFGDFLTRILAKEGLNLKSQLRNQNLARLGSTWDGAPDMRPVTLDLSMASDTLSIELVRELLPRDWFNALDDLRSLRGRLDNVEHPWEKFSSMGNGFTFQLESMIFYALTCAVAKQLGFPHGKVSEDRNNIAVYGDDIICPAGMALVLTQLLAFTGFKLNLDKSFLFGPFRESCGTDWFEGRDVRPLYLKRQVKNAKDLIFVANISSRVSPYGDSTLEPLALRSCLVRYCLSGLPALVRDNLLGPRVEDLEGHIHVLWDEAQKSRFVLWNRNLQTWSYASIKSRALEFSALDGPLYLQLMGSNGFRSSSTSDGGAENSVIPNSRDERFVLAIIKTISEPLNAGTVYRRKATRSVLTTQSSDGWRND